MDSSFVTFSPKRKLKKTVHSKITKLSLRHPKRGQDKKTTVLRQNKSPPRRDSLQQTCPLTRISNLSAEFHRDDVGEKYFDAENISPTENKPDLSKTSLPNGEHRIRHFDPSRRDDVSQFTCSVQVNNKTRFSKHTKSTKIKTEVRTPPSVLRYNSVVVISESSSDESSSVAMPIPKKSSDPNVNIVISESDSEPESANSVDKSILARKAINTVIQSSTSPDKQFEIKKWLQNISPKCKNNHNSREDPVISHKSVVHDTPKSWRSPIRIPASSESEDNFEEFIKSIKTKNKLLQQKLDTPDSLRNFLTDGSAENSPAFYLSLTNKLQTEEKKKAIAGRIEKVHPVELKFESDAETSDEETKGLIAVQEGRESSKVISSPVTKASDEEPKIITAVQKERENAKADSSVDTESSDEDTRGLVAVQEENKKITVVSSSDVETVSSDTASGDSEDDSVIPPTRPPTNSRIETPYQKQLQKVLSCRKPKNIVEKSNTVSQFPVFSFLASLSYNVPQQQSHSDAVLYKKEFKKRKEDLCSKLFSLYNLEVFKNQLPSDMSVTWNSRLMKTAGLCYNKYSANKRTSRIELSVKVCDTADRLRDTLIHEMCHSASWVIDGVKIGHGTHWKRWAGIAMKRFPDIPPIRRCHDYKIATKFTYKCVQCGYSIGRHSKSLDLERKRCGYCLGKFELFVNKHTSTRNSKTPAQLQTPRTPSAFAVFVKENYGSVKKERSDLKHGEVMKLLGQKFAAIKVSTCLNTV